MHTIKKMAHDPQRTIKYDGFEVVKDHDRASSNQISHCRGRGYSVIWYTVYNGYIVGALSQRSAAKFLGEEIVTGRAKPNYESWDDDVDVYGLACNLMVANRDNGSADDLARAEKILDSSLVD